jgi:cytoskeleton protein RodZ
MESIGEKLRLARERNNLTIDQVARETHVAKRFLKGLEEEDFSVFPGETYAMGFLRNYAEYLGLSPDELVGIYRNIKIQEQPLPMDQLLDKRPKIPTRLILIAVAGILVLALGGYLIYRAFNRGPSGTSQSPAASSSSDFVFQDEVRTQWFTQGDGITIPYDGKSYRVVVSSVGDSLTLKVPGGTVDLGLGKERYIDLNSDSNPELRIVWNDVDRTPAQKRVNLGLYRTTGQSADAAAAAAADASSTAVPGVTPVALGTPSVTFKPVSVIQAAQTGLFTLVFTFKNDCYFCYLVDDKDREDKFFQKGEELSIDTARTKVTVWLSNAGAARMRVQGRDFELGGLGEVATRAIAWQKDANAGGYVLQITALD